MNLKCNLKCQTELASLAWIDVVQTGCLIILGNSSGSFDTNMSYKHVCNKRARNSIMFLGYKLYKRKILAQDIWPTPDISL